MKLNGGSDHGYIDENKSICLFLLNSHFIIVYELRIPLFTSSHHISGETDSLKSWVLGLFRSLQQDHVQLPEGKLLFKILKYPSFPCL